MPDIEGRPALLVQATVERKITAQGKKTIKYAIISLVILIILAVAIVGYLIDKQVVEPIADLRNHVIGVTQTGDLSSRMSFKSKDEIGALARKYDFMLEELQESRRRMLDQSFRSGMSEMAAGVLHNIKNILTGIIGNLDFLRRDLEKTPADVIEKAGNELKELQKQGGAKARKAELVRFISQANQDLLTLNAKARKSLDGILQLTGGITSILRDHESWARNDKVPEKIMLLTLVNDSVQFMEKNLQDATADPITITVDPSVDEIGTVTVHQFTMLQVLNNVLNNGAESIIRRGTGDGHIHVSGTFEKTGSGMLVHLQISDNGEGMAEETLKRIFERHFSSKDKKTSGIGLHWCANTITAMGGRMYAESAGLGRGSSVHITFPAGLREV
jgi:signal transduction histidine kinase